VWRVAGGGTSPAGFDLEIKQGSKEVNCRTRPAAELFQAS
jgi:hypothetical protein